MTPSCSKQLGGWEQGVAEGHGPLLTGAGFGAPQCPQEGGAGERLVQSLCRCEWLKQSLLQHSHTTMPSLLPGPAASHTWMGGKPTRAIWAWAPAMRHCGFWGLGPAQAAETRHGGFGGGCPYSASSLHWIIQPKRLPSSFLYFFCSPVG